MEPYDISTGAWLYALRAPLSVLFFFIAFTVGFMRVHVPIQFLLRKGTLR